MYLIVYRNDNTYLRVFHIWEIKLALFSVYIAYLKFALNKILAFSGMCKLEIFYRMSDTHYPVI